jgi:hypothetical protein
MNVGSNPTRIVLSEEAIMPRSVLGPPAAIARRSNLVLRPRDLANIYAHPRAEVARLAANGLLRRLATGYYAVVPQRRLGDKSWRPSIESAALGIAIADYGVDAVALMGLSAARQLQVVPRAVAHAVVAVPRQRPELNTDFGLIHFVKRDVRRLDVQRVDTELVAGWATSPEQTLIDLLTRPDLAPLPASDQRQTIAALARQADRGAAIELATGQRRAAARSAIERMGAANAQG